MAPLRTLVVVLLLAASLANSLPQDGQSRNLDFTFTDKMRVQARRVSGRDLTRPRRQSPFSRHMDYNEGSGKLEHKDETDLDEPGIDSDGGAFDVSGRSCPGDSTYTCRSGDIICMVNTCDGLEDCPDGDDEQDCECYTDEFLCDNTKCIPKDSLCDGFDDCQDKTDELDCSAPCASPKNFTCIDGACAARCDGNLECLDNADEENCPTTTTPSPITPTPSVITTTAYECSSDEFLCDNAKCIPKDWLCDGDEDCEDKTDELDCSATCASPKNFTCSDGKCAARCDGNPECLDNADEENCRTTTSTPATTTSPRCGAGQWQCRDGGCISGKDRCDGCVHCRDGSDEEGCRPRHCRHWEFRCRDGSCINKRLRCNGRRDCRDGSDERHCRPHWFWPRPWHRGQNRVTEADRNLQHPPIRTEITT